MTTSKFIEAKYLVLLVIAAALLAVVALWATGLFLGPLPPRVVVMTTGPEGSPNHAFAIRYKKILSREGIDLKLLTSNGAVDNLDRLRDPRCEVSVGFGLEGTTDEDESPDLMSLGTVAYEPLWMFYRGTQPYRRPEGFKGWRLSIEPPGSGTRKLVLELLTLVGVSRDTVELYAFTPEGAADALLQGKIDAAAMLASWESPIVRRLLASEQVEALSFRRADAAVALRPFLHKLVLPEGVGDMAKNRPPATVVLVAPKTSLVVRNTLHPAIQYLLLEAATQVHSGPGVFRQLGQYPAPESIDLPLSPDARHFFKSGPPFLQRYLPFWMAVWVARSLVFLIPIVAFLYPLLRVTPFLYEWQMRRRIYVLYGELKFLEADFDERPVEQPVDDLIQRLDALQARANARWIPLWYSDRFYMLRQHLQLVWERLERRQRDQCKLPPE